DRVGNGNLPSSQRTMAKWFDASAFLAPTTGSGHFGNSGKGIIVGPGRNVFNCALAKNLKPTERIGVRLQVQYQNVLNHPNWGNPNLGISTPATVGTITSMGTREGSGQRSGLLSIFVDF